jgi:hypothetical protein
MEMKKKMEMKTNFEKRGGCCADVVYQIYLWEYFKSD